MSSLALACCVVPEYISVYSNLKYLAVKGWSNVYATTLFLSSATPVENSSYSSPSREVKKVALRGKPFCHWLSRRVANRILSMVTALLNSTEISFLKSAELTVLVSRKVSKLPSKALPGRLLP